MQQVFKPTIEARVLTVTESGGFHLVERVRHMDWLVCLNY